MLDFLLHDRDLLRKDPGSVSEVSASGRVGGRAVPFPFGTETRNPGTIKQNLPQPFPMLLFSLCGRSGCSRRLCPLVRELRHNIRLG